MHILPYQPIIEGRSGCQLFLVEDETTKKIAVRKMTVDTNYIPRLVQQAQKQKSFLYTNKLPAVTCPKIYTERLTTNSYYFDMEYLQTLNFIDLFSLPNRQWIPPFIDYVLQTITQTIEQSAFEPINTTIIFKKILELEAKLENHPCLNDKISLQIKELMLSYLEKVSAHVELPTGKCHGDLSLSNLLFCPDSNQLIVLDFLDTFYESPIQDCVKLRQDTCYQYCLQIVRVSDPVKLANVLDCIDNQLVAHFLKYEFYREFYSLFQLINFVRILPYAQNLSMVEFLLHIIQTNWGNQQ